jgi:hypothetical protein
MTEKRGWVRKKITKTLDRCYLTREVQFIFLNFHFRQHLKIVVGWLVCVLPQEMLHLLSLLLRLLCTSTRTFRYLVQWDQKNPFNKMVSLLSATQSRNTYKTLLRVSMDVLKHKFSLIYLILKIHRVYWKSVYHVTYCITLRHSDLTYIASVK